MIETNKALPILRQVLGSEKQTSKDEYYYKCPSCNHHKRKLAINIRKNAFHCWICDYYGRNIRRVIRRFGSYLQLQKWDQITDRTDITRFSELFMEDRLEESEAKLELPSEFVSLANKDLPLSANRALRYLRERGVERKDIQRWKIGFCFDGEFGGRIIIPSFGMTGHLNYFIARSYTDYGMRYKNPEASKNIVFNELYTNWNEDLVIVEGVFDAIIAGNAVPILGSTLREDSKLLRKIVENDTPCYIALDPDAFYKEQKIIEMLLRYDVELYKIDVSGYEDVGSMPKEIFEQRKTNATFIERENYLLLNLLAAV